MSGAFETSLRRKRLAAVWKPVALLSWSRTAPAGAVQASQLLLRLKTLLGDLAIDTGILRGPTEKPKEEEKNPDSEYDQAPPEHDTLLPCLKRQPLLVPASPVSSSEVKPATFKPANLLTFLFPMVYNLWLRARKSTVPCFPSGSPPIVPNVAAPPFTAPKEEASASTFSTNCSLSVRTAASAATPAISASVSAIQSTSPANTTPNAVP